MELMVKYKSYPIPVEKLVEKVGTTSKIQGFAYLGGQSKMVLVKKF